MEKKELSPKQLKVYNFVKQHILENGYPPTVREIAMGVNLKSTSSVHTYLEGIEKKGWIKRSFAKSRTIEIIDDEFDSSRTDIVDLPVVGTVAAGSPILAVENIQSYFPVPSDIVPRKESFVLKVKGDSMINVGIYDGDHIFVESCNTANNGEIIVALIDDSATVKTFYKEKNFIRLQPENDDMEPIIVNECIILGKVFGIFRLF